MQNVIVLVSTLILALLGGCSAPVNAPQHTLPHTCSIYDMKQARCIGPEEFSRRIARYRVLFVGDHHASRTMHERLAVLIDTLGSDGRHILLANEWFTPEDDKLLSQYAKGSFDGNFTAAVGWQKKAGYPFDSYRNIYASVIRQQGELYGINMSKSLQKAISDSNFTTLSPSQQTFVTTLDMNLSAHREMLAPFFSKCHAEKKGESSSECLERMYRVQVAWDSYMGEQSARLSREKLHDENDLLIVFAGAFHLEYGVGINARFARLSDEPFVTMLPVPAGTETVDAGEADFLLIYPTDTAKKESDDH
jgi:uncharacterized iron-regulated protein